MKTVFSSNSELIHTFAQRSHPEGRTSTGNVFFYNDKLYSYGYHYCLAEFIDNYAVMINDKGYSNSTSKHISIAISALSHCKRFYTTETDLELVYNSIQWNLKKLAKSRKPAIYIDEILSLWESLNEYIDYVELKVKRSSKYRELKKIVNSINNNVDNYKEALKKLSKDKAKAEKVRANKLKKEALDKFMSYESRSFRIRGVDDYVRISQCGKYVETSQHVRVPINEARLLYKLIKAGKDIKGYKIDNYTVISINGTLKIGCHNININSVKEVGEKIL